MSTPAIRTSSRIPKTHEHGEPLNVGGRQGTGSEVSNESNPTCGFIKEHNYRSED